MGSIKWSRSFQTTFIAISLAVISLDGLGGENIKNYSIFFAEGSYQGKNVLILRKYEQSGKIFFLGLDPVKLQTQIFHSEQISVKTLSMKGLISVYKNTPYVNALEAALKKSYPLQDAGITHGFPQEHGITLTIDLCPSKKPLDRIIFTSLITEFSKTERPVPVALSITGKFMLDHPDDIQWLKGLVEAGEISVTWVNHTYNHNYDPKIPLRSNFLLEPGTDLNFEILGTEIAMLERGLTPSVFFRFPGLVSDQKIVGLVVASGLIPVGSDAWLAKGQRPETGSIVLIHGNGNEPVGVKDFIKLLQTRKSEVLNHQWLLYDLHESVEGEFKY